MDMTRPAQISQNKKFGKIFAISQEVSDEVDFFCRLAPQLSINRYYDSYRVLPGMPKVP